MEGLGPAEISYINVKEEIEKGELVQLYKDYKISAYPPLLSLSTYTISN